MGVVKFGNCGVGEVMIIKNGVVKNLNVKIGSGQAAHMYDLT